MQTRPNPGGCDFLEDPDLDARTADPVWLPDPDALIALGPAVRDDSDPFSVWSIPGRKSLVHDGKRLLVRTRLGRRVVRLAVSLALSDGMPYAYAVASGPRARSGALAATELAEALTGSSGPGRGAAVSRGALVNMRALQALDALAVGASERDIAVMVFGTAETDATWNASATRAMVRYLVRHGRRMRDGSYRALLRAATPSSAL